MGGRHLSYQLGAEVKGSLGLYCRTYSALYSSRSPHKATKRPSARSVDPSWTYQGRISVLPGLGTLQTLDHHFYYTRLNTRHVANVNIELRKYS